MNEHSFVESIHRRLKKHPLHVWKINARFANGVPDAWYSGGRGDVWVEYKWGRNPPSALQIKWLEDRHREGRRCWLVIGDERGVQIIDRPPYNRPQKTVEQSFYSVAEYISTLLLTCSLSQENNHDTNSQS